MPIALPKRRRDNNSSPQSVGNIGPGTSTDDRTRQYARALERDSLSHYELDTSPRSCESNASSFQCFNTHSPPILNLSPNLSPINERQRTTPGMLEIGEQPVATSLADIGRQFAASPLYPCIIDGEREPIMLDDPPPNKRRKVANSFVGVVNENHVNVNLLGSVTEAQQQSRKRKGDKTAAVVECPNHSIRSPIHRSRSSRHSGKVTTQSSTWGRSTSFQPTSSQRRMVELVNPTPPVIPLTFVSPTIISSHSSPQHLEQQSPLSSTQNYANSNETDGFLFYNSSIGIVPQVLANYTLGPTHLHPQSSVGLYPTLTGNTPPAFIPHSFVASQNTYISPYAVRLAPYEGSEANINQGETMPQPQSYFPPLQPQYETYQRATRQFTRHNSLLREMEASLNSHDYLRTQLPGLPRTDPLAYFLPYPDPTFVHQQQPIHSQMRTRHARDPLQAINEPSRPLRDYVRIKDYLVTDNY